LDQHLPAQGGPGPLDGRFRVACSMLALRHGGTGIKIAVPDFRPRRC
jgi:hypothetical protein